MAFWTGSIQDINEGLAANDGSGDTIRAAFFKVDANFQQVNNFLGNTTIDFLTANVVNQFNAGNANIVNLTTNSLTITNAVATGNITAGNLIANVGGIYTSGQSYFGSNINIAGAIVPVGSGLYDLGSPSNPFRNLYYVSAVSGGTVTTSDAGMLIVHANALVGDVKDVGIQGNVSHGYTSSANAYAFYGFQKTTQDFIYKIGPTNWAVGNSVAYDGVYGAAHFGSGNFSNTTISTATTNGALVVGGGAGIGGNLNVGGNTRITGDVYITGTAYASGNYQVITTSLIGNPNAPLYTGGVITGNAVFVSSAASGNVYTGAVTIPYGGLGVYGNISAGGINGPYYGQVRTADQPYITSLGTLPTLTASTINFTNLNGTNITAGGSLNFSGATMTGLSSLSIGGNISAGNLISNAGVFATSIYSNGYKYANGAAFVSTTIANTTEIIANVSSGTLGLTLTTTGVTAGNYGSATSIPTIVVDSKGRVTSLTANAVSTTINLAGGTGTGNVAGGGTLTVSGSTGLTTSVSGSTISLTNTGVTSATGSYGLTVSASTGAVTFTNSGVTSLIAGTDISVSSSTGNITVNDTSTLNTVLGRGATTTTTMTVGTILPSANLTYNIGSTSAWFNTFYGVSSQAKYADLAERYTSDADYEPGTVVVFGGDAEITVTNRFADVSVAGAISTDPAYLMNAMEEGLPVALRGRVPVKVIGPVTKGDLLVTAGQNPGYATSVGKSTEYPLAVFAKAIETDTAEGTKVITAVIL